MRIIFLAATALAALAVSASAQTAPAREERGALRVENVPETPPDVADRLRQYVNTRSAGFSDWLPDGGVLITTRFGETTQLHRVDRPMGARTQLTFFDERIVSAQVKPGTNEILFTRDVGGNENFGGYLLDPATGRTRLLTEAGTRNQGFVFSDDGEQIAWAYVPSTEPNYDVFVGDPDDARVRRRVYDAEGAAFPLDFSPDGRRLLMQRYVSVAESHIFILDVATNAITRVAPDIRVAYGGGEFSQDGRSIIVLSDENSQFQRLVRIDLATGQRSVISPSIPWGIESFDLSPDGRTIAYVVNENGRSSLRLMDLRNLRQLPAPDLPPGIVSGVEFDRKSRRIGFSLNSSTAPGDVYSWDLRSRELTRWTTSETGGIPQATFVDPELITWRSFDNREISGFLYRPRTPGPHR